MKNLISESIAKTIMLVDASIENLNFALHEMYIQGADTTTISDKLNNLNSSLIDLKKEISKNLSKEDIKSIKKSQEKLLDEIWKN